MYVPLQLGAPRHSGWIVTRIYLKTVKGMLNVCRFRPSYGLLTLADCSAERKTPTATCADDYLLLHKSNP